MNELPCLYAYDIKFIKCLVTYPMKIIVSTLLLAFVLTGCISTPKTALYNGKEVGTYSAAAGCSTLGLDEDCSMSGCTRKIAIDGINLRIGGGKGGTVVFIMSMPTFIPDQPAIQRGGLAVQNYLESKGVHIIETKVMYSNDTLAGVHFTLDQDGYSLLKELTVK
ncbi:MAG: hypothetical protein SFY80_16950 [Verrucomicrobiota bacterium]|nr:hypothetical protein [Verrucomicrobiota bacterium]